MAINLQKGQKISLSKEVGGALSMIVMGLGWDSKKSGGGLLKGMFGGGSSSSAIDLDASFSQLKGSTMATATLLLALFLAAPLGAASPRCAPPEPVRLDSLYAYTMSIVDSLGWLRQGIMRMPVTGPRDVSEVLAALAQTQGDFACAGNYLAPFVKSGSVGIRTSAETLVAACTRVRASTEAMTAALQAQADEARQGKPPGAMTADERMEEVVQRKDKAWGDLMIAAADAVGVLVEFRDEKRTGRLLVTKEERKDLKSHLEKKFGKSIRDGRKDEQDFPTMVAAGWYEILANPQFRSLDDVRVEVRP